MLVLTPNDIHNFIESLGLGIPIHEEMPQEMSTFILHDQEKRCAYLIDHHFSKLLVLYQNCYRLSLFNGRTFEYTEPIHSMQELEQYREQLIDSIDFLLDNQGLYSRTLNFRRSFK